MYKNRVKNDRSFFEIPALLSCEWGNREWENIKYIFLIFPLRFLLIFLVCKIKKMGISKKNLIHIPWERQKMLPSAFEVIVQLPVYILVFIILFHYFFPTLANCVFDRLTCFCHFTIFFPLSTYFIIDQLCTLPTPSGTF